MFPLVFAVAHGLAHGPAVELDKLTVGDAASLHGQLVRVTCPATAPADTFAGWTTTGVEVGGVERVLQLAGKVDIRQGETVTALGVLKVRTIPAAVVNGQQVTAATSVVVVGVRVRGIGMLAGGWPGAGTMTVPATSRGLEVSRTPDALTPLPAGPPWMVQPGYPVPSRPVYPTAALPAHVPPAPSEPPAPTLLALARAALGGVTDSLRYLFGL